ncbi:MAG: Uma2 family endonuclease [Myxococcales bacterium]|nr:Uma2 family endonuclease [Myxococcales bacterium]
MSSAAPRLITEEEFLALPESTERLELLDGEVILAPSPSYRHQLVLRRIVRALEDWAACHDDEVTIGMAPLDVRFAPGRILQPDAFLCFGATPDAHEGPINIIPDLCVEVLSTNRAYDRMTKRLVYAEAGVRELWTVSTDGTIERWCGERLSHCETHQGRLTTPLLADFVLDLSDL